MHGQLVIRKMFVDSTWIYIYVVSVASWWYSAQSTKVAWQPTYLQENWHTTFTLAVSTLWGLVEKNSRTWFLGLKMEY